jgi:uncharacterized SAM-binding protein YcdF (DUF218 family)
MYPKGPINGIIFTTLLREKNLLFKLFIRFYKVKKYIIITVLYVTDYIVISGSLARTLEASSSPSARESSERPPPAIGSAVGTAK